MKCSELQLNLSLYADGQVPDERLKEHLDICPLCRQEFAEIRDIKIGLRRMSKPSISRDAHIHLKRAVRAELRTRHTSWLPISVEFRQWVIFRVMPYAAGLLASLVIGFSFVSILSSTGQNPGLLAATTHFNDPDPTVLANNRDRFHQRNVDDMTPSEYARTRLDIASESPSVNPRGALIALTRSLVRGNMKDDEVTVVADVFGNGLAQIAEVVEPSRNSRAVSQLEKALDSDPAYAPFVSSNLDNRSDNVRVVLKFQTVDVSTGERRRRH
jgi:hypothetical protein